jgi:hypothetical protein
MLTQLESPVIPTPLPRLIAGNTAQQRFVLWGGPAMTMASVMGAHAMNFSIRPEAYADAPPSISRAIVDPVVGQPFAIAIFITAALILAGVLLTHSVYCWLTVALDRPAKARLRMFLVCECVAVAGMVLLSQFRTPDWQVVHNAGSHMLFFGHTFGILLAGNIAAELGAATGKDRAPDSISTGRILHAMPLRAGLVAVSALIFGVLYFGGRHLPDSWFFWQRLCLAIWEVALLAMFVAFVAGNVQVIRLAVYISSTRKQPESRVAMSQLPAEITGQLA